MAESVIVGIDEAGRGALAGPVVAGAVVLSPEIEAHSLITDSKKLTPEKREECYRWMIDTCIWGSGQASASEIDELGILEANQLAMQRALQKIEEKIKPTYLLIDGRDQFWFDYPHSSVIKGDEKEPCIAAASIVAKVTRDRLMIGYEKSHPGYLLAEHKGYGTEEHFAAIQSKGISELHRKTFLKKLAT